MGRPSKFSFTGYRKHKQNLLDGRDKIKFYLLSQGIVRCEWHLWLLLVEQLGHSSEMLEWTGLGNLLTH